MNLVFVLKWVKVLYDVWSVHSISLGNVGV